MKKKLCLSMMVLSASLALHAQIPMDRFVKTTGGSTNFTTGSRSADAVKGIAEDGYSNTYVIGNYTGSISFQQYNGTPTSSGHSTGSPTTVNYTSAGGQDVYLARYDIDGNCTWSASMGGTGFDEGNAICFGTALTPPTEFFVTGTFSESMTVSGTNTLTVTYPGTGSADAFIIRFTTGASTNPAASWWRNFGGGLETNGLGIAANGSNVFITGYYTEFVDNPTTGNIELEKTHTNGTTGSFSTSSSGYLEFPERDMFVARYSLTGTYGDALNTYGSEDQVEGHGIALYGSDLYVTGFYKGSIKLTSSLVTCSGHSDIFTARYPQSFTPGGVPYAAAYAATAGGSTTVYQAAPEEPFYKQDVSNGIVVNAQGVFITGTFMDAITFGSTPYDPSGGSTDNYMFLTRYSLTLTSPLVATGGSNISEGQAIFAVSYLGISTCFVTGSAVSNSTINGTSVETNSCAPENVGYMARIAYSPTTNAYTNSFVDGLARNADYLDGTGADDINVYGYAISYRVGCGVRVGGKFSSKTFFGNETRTASGTNDAFLLVRENSTTITANTVSCGSVVLTGTYSGSGTPSYTWTGPSGTIGSTSSVTVTPTVNTTYTFAVSGSATCPVPNSIVSVYTYPNSSTVSAGADQHICEGTHTVVIGSPAVSGVTYSWAPTGSLSSSTVAQPTATVSSNTTYTLTATDKCGNISTDQVVVYYAPTCIHRMSSAEAFAAMESKEVSIYPNPNNGSFTIDAHSSELKDIYIYDEMGKLVFTLLQTTDSTIPVDLSTLSKGLYLVKVVNGTTIDTQKIVNQ